MATARPESMIISPGVFDETKISNRKSLPTYGHSSSSSIDSANGNHVNIHQQSPSPQNLLQTTASSTTTDSDFESEQDDNLQLQPGKKAERLERRKKRFYKLFKSEIPDDMPEIIDSYVCAYQGDILLQGKMYITDRYLCFHSRIINYVTKHVYRWEQIERVTKERVAFIFPTAIGIRLKKNGKKIIYASFIQRDQAFEKILSVCSRFNNDAQSYDDDDNDIPNDGTLKATHHNGRSNYHSREIFDINDANEQEVLQLCLKNNNQRGISPKRKHSDDKPSSKKFEKKTSTKNSNENISNNQTTRHSRYTKNEQKSNDKNKRNNSRVNHRSQSHNRDRTLSQPDQTISHSNSSLNIQPSTPNSSSHGILKTIISFVNQIYRNFSSYPMKTTVIIFLVLTILFLHSFYLIKLAYRIENRLNSLYNFWPSSSSVKNSISSNTKKL